MKYKTLILLASLSLTACKSTYQEQREAALASRPMTVETVQKIIDTTTHVNIQEDAFQGKGQYLDQALYSAAKQIIELQLEPRYLSLEFKLTPEMYYGDWGGFVVALDSPWLLEKGAIEQPLEEIAVLSTNNLYNSHISDDISFSKYNRQILRGIAVAAIDTPLSTKHIAGRGLFGSSLTEKQDLLLSTDFRGFTDNVEKNVSLMSSLITNYNPYGYNAQFSHHSANSKFDPITYAQKGLGETKRAVSFIAVDAQEARNMVGKKYHFVFIPV